MGMDRLECFPHDPNAVTMARVPALERNSAHARCQVVARRASGPQNPKASPNKTRSEGIRALSEGL
jgi:hypothetical protein